MSRALTHVLGTNNVAREEHAEMTARLLVIGLDGSESSLLRYWGNEGALPTFGRLQENGAGWSLARDNPMDTLPGALWPQINSGLSVAKLGHYNYPRQLRTG